MRSPSAFWDTIVVGGGLAGLIAARELSEAGFSVLLIEGRDRLGGRTAYRNFAADSMDLMIELGGTYVHHTQKNVLRECERYGVALISPPEIERFIWHLGGARWEGERPIPCSETVEAECALAKIRAGAARTVLDFPHCLQDIGNLDISVVEIVEGLKVGPVTRDLILAWATLYTGTTPSAASAIYHLHSMALLGGSPVARSPSLVMATGTSGLVNGISGDFRGEVRLGTRLTSVLQDGGGISIATDTGEVHRCSRAVLALPANTLKDVQFDPPLSKPKQKLIEIGHESRTLRFFALVENVPENVQAIGWGVNGVVWLSTDKRTADQNLLVGFACPTPEFDSFNHDDIRKIVSTYLPEAKVIAVDGHDWSNDRFSRGAWMGPRPGQTTGLEGSHLLDEGRLFFAGSDFSLGWLSWMEGALETGIQAARRIVAVERNIYKTSQ